MTTLLIQLFWLSIVFIGAVILVACEQYVTIRGVRTLLGFCKQAHPFTQFLLSFAAGITVFIPIVVPGYIFIWPIYILVVAYLLVLTVSVALALFMRQKIKKYVLIKIKEFDKQSLIFMGLCGLTLVAGIILDMHIGGSIQGDNTVHIARINLMTRGHMTYSDPYFGYNGIVDPRYSANLLGALQAAAATLLRTTAVFMWRESHAFYRIIAWFSIFTLLWNFLPKATRKYWSYLVLFFVPMLQSSFFQFPELPDRVVLVWTILFIIGLKRWLEGKGRGLLIWAAVLIALTHLINAMMLLVFLAIFALGLVVFKEMNIKRLKTLGLVAIIFLIPSIYNLHYPNNISKSTVAFNAGPISGEELVFRNYGPIAMARIPTMNLLTLGVYLFVIGCALALKNTKYKKFRSVVIWFLAFIALLVYTPPMFAFLGYYYFFRNTQNKAVRLMLITLFSLYALAVYNPITTKLVHMHKLPPWLLSRFSEVNMFTFFAPLIGLVVMFSLLLRLARYRRPEFIATFVAAFCVMFVLTTVYPSTGPKDYASAYRRKKTLNIHVADEVNDLGIITAHSNGQLLLSDEGQAPYYLMMVSKVHLYSMESETNAAPMSNILLRKACAEQLGKSMDLSALQSAGITQILTSTYGDPKSSYDGVAQKKPYLKLIQTQGEYKLYSVPSSKVAPAKTACTIPYGQ